MDTKIVLEKYARAIRQAMDYERNYSKEAGFKEGHYWLHRKLDQIMDEAEDHFLHGEDTPHFPNE